MLRVYSNGVLVREIACDPNEAFALALNVCGGCAWSWSRT